MGDKEHAYAAILCFCVAIAALIWGGYVLIPTMLDDLIVFVKHWYIWVIVAAGVISGIQFLK